MLSLSCPTHLTFAVVSIAQQPQAAGAPRITVEHSGGGSEPGGWGGSRHTRITVQRVGPSGPNPFQEYVCYPLYLLKQFS